MNDERREELISAYVDGELTTEERAQVELWLAESAEARQLYEEWLAVRAAMSALPRQSVGRNLSASVLHRAERSVLSGVVKDAGDAAEPTVSLGTRLRTLWNSGAGSK